MLNQASGYALTAMGCIAAGGGRPVLVKEIAEIAAIPAPYLAKIVNALARRGLVRTQRGIGGGVTLSKAAVEITMLDVCVALDDPVTQPACMMGTAECSDDRACPAHKFWSGARSKVLEFLEQTTIADIAAFEQRRLWKGPRKSETVTPTVSAKKKK